MGYYTPDWIHIRSEWDFLVLPLAALIGVVVLGILFFIYPRRFPKERMSRLRLFVGAILITVALTVICFVRLFWAVRAVDFIAQGGTNAQIITIIEKALELPLPQKTTVSAATMFGWREYVYWYGVRVDTKELIPAAQKAGYEEMPYDKVEQDFRRPEVVTKWAKETGFTPTQVFRRQSETGARVTIVLDQARGLALIQAVDS